MEKYSMRDFLTDCVRVIVVIASVVILVIAVNIKAFILTALLSILV